VKVEPQANTVLVVASDLLQRWTANRINASVVSSINESSPFLNRFYPHNYPNINPCAMQQCNTVIFVR